MVYVLFTIDENNRKTLKGIFWDEQSALDAAFDLEIYFEDMGWAGLSTRVEQTVVQGKK